MRIRACILMILAPVMSAWSQAATLPRAPDPLPPIMLEWAGAQKRFGDIQVPFTQTRTVPALKAPVVSQGRFWRFTDGSFRWELGQPTGTVLVHDEKEFRVKESPEAPWQVLDEKDGRYRMWSQFMSGRDSSPEELARNFNVKVVSNESGTVTVAMTPRPLVVKRFLKQVQMRIDSATMRLRQLHVIQGDGATLTMRFGEPKSVSSKEKARLLAR